MNYLEIQKATLHLFNCLCVPNITEKRIINEAEVNNVVNQYIKSGIFLTDKAAINICRASMEDARYIFEALRKYKFQFNELVKGALTKSFKEANEISDEELYVRQTLEYLSSAIGNWQYDPRVFILTNKVDNKRISVKLIQIGMMNIEEIKAEVEKSFVNSSIAYSLETIEALKTLIKELNIQVDISKIKNKELRCVLYESLDIIPKDPTDLLRYLVYIRVRSSLLIKSKEFINLVKYNVITNKENKVLTNYIKNYGINNLATIFYRYKHIWLALRFPTIDNTGTLVRPEYRYYINRIRRLAVKYHVPTKTKILDRVFTTKFGAEFMEEWEKETENASIYKLISIYNSALTRRDNHEFDMFRIRNGKVFVKEASNKVHPQTVEVDIEWYLIFLLRVISKRISDRIQKVYGRPIKVHFSDKIDYAVPTSEKAYWGNIPFGTSFTAGKNIVIGIHWYNVDNNRIDLDLHRTDICGTTGWYNYRDNRGSEIIYTGDVTNAVPQLGGATEAFYIDEKNLMNSVIRINWYNYDTGYKPTYRLFISSLDENVTKSPTKDAIIESKNLAFASSENTFADNCNENIVGYVRTSDEGNKEFVVENLGFGKSHISRHDDKAVMIIKALESKKYLSFKALSMYVENMVITEDPNEADINFADVANLNKATFINIIG